MSDSLIAGTNTTDTGAQQGAASESTAAASTAMAGEGAAVQQQAGAKEAAATGDKPAGEANTEGAAKTEGEGKPPGAPEKYEFKAPDGRSFNPEVLEAYESVARELNMPQEAAQKMLDTIGPKIAAVQMENFQKVQNEWAETAKGDKEFGGERLAENLAVAKKALDTFGTPELRTLLNETGLGNHPELIRAFYKAGKAISEDKFVPAGAGKGPQGGKDLSSRLYPNQPKN